MRHTLLFALALVACTGVACTGDSADIQTPPPTLPPVPTDITLVPGAVGESVALEMNVAGGGNGAPEGLVFIVPPGAQSTATAIAGELSDGSKGFSLEVTQAGDAVVCTQAILLAPTSHFKTRIKVSGLVPGPESWMGLNVELRSRASGGELVSPPGGRYSLLRNFRADADWLEWEADLVPAPGAVRGEVCYRFVNSTGKVEVDRLEVVAPGVPIPAAVPEPNGAEAAPASEVRLELDAPGGGAGAPQGFDFVIPDPTGVTLTAADLGDGAKGIHFAVSQAGNAAACSQFLPLGPRGVARGRVKLSDIQTDGRDWTGFVAEVRAFNSAGGLVAAGTTPYTTVYTGKSVAEWKDFQFPFSTPGGAVSGKLCLRFVESTGTADVDWVAVSGS